MKNASDKIRRENQNVFYIQWIFPENRAVYEIMWKIIVEPEKPQMTIYSNTALALCMLDS